MKRIKITIEGVNSCLINRFTDEAAEGATEGSGAKNTGERLTPREDAESRLYTDEKGKVIAIAPGLLRMITDAGSFHKVGRNKVSTQKSSLIPAAVTFTEPYYPLISKDGWKVDTRPIRIPATGGRINRHRPMFDDWKITFEVELNTSILSEKLFRAIVDDAGMRIGFGDFRPACRGPFGKFKVTLWKSEEIKPSTKAA